MKSIAGNGVAQFNGQFPAGVFGGFGEAAAEFDGSGQVDVLSNQAGTVGIFQNFDGQVGFEGPGFAAASGKALFFSMLDKL